LLLREDFSGSGMVSICWMLSSPRRQSWAVDFDPEVHLMFDAEVPLMFDAEVHLMFDAEVPLMFDPKL
jgi:hypothetical protein